MHKIFLLLFTLSLLSCNDGDYEVPSVDFTETVNKCGTYVLYLTNSSKTEALIIQLDESDISNEVAVTEVAISSANCNYRIFDDAVGTDYFCADVPVVSPTVIKNWEAVAGDNNQIQITTTAVYGTDNVTITAYKHKLVLENLVLENEGEQIIYESYNFGSFTTSI